MTASFSAARRAPDLLRRLAQALATSDPARALQVELSSSGFSEAEQAQVQNGALSLLGRAQRRAPSCSAGELALALGVLLALRDPARAEETEAERA